MATLSPEGCPTTTINAFNVHNIRCRSIQRTSAVGNLPEVSLLSKHRLQRDQCPCLDLIKSVRICCAIQLLWKVKITGSLFLHTYILFLPFCLDMLQSCT